MSSASLTERTATGVAWGAGGALAYQVFALFAQTALTYLLTKGQYGLYGTAFSVLGFTMLLQQIGFNEILLRRRRLRLWVSTAFWSAVTLGVAGSLLLVTSAYPVGWLYNNAELRELLLLASPIPLIRSLLVVPSLQLIQAMRFRTHYGLMLINAVATTSLTVGLAWIGLGSKSFIVAMLIAEPMYAVAVWQVSASNVKGRPVRRSRWLPLAKNARFVFGSNAARWVRTSIDPLVLGLFAPQEVVGVYFFAQSMVSQIFRVVTLNLSGVLLPALNKISDEPARQTAGFLRAARAVTLIGAPLCVGLGAVGPVFVRVFLDSHKWSALPPVLAALGVGMVFRLLDEPIQSLLSAQGRFRLGFRLALGTSLIYIVTCSLGSLGGTALSLAMAAAAYYIVIGPCLLTVAISVGGGRFSDAMRVFYVPLLLAIVAIAPWLLLDRWIPGQGRPRDALVLASIVAGSFVSYLALGRLFKPDGWCELLERIQQIVPRQFKSLLARIGGNIPQIQALAASEEVTQDLRKH